MGHAWIWAGGIQQPSWGASPQDLSSSPSLSLPVEDLHHGVPQVPHQEVRTLTAAILDGLEVLTEPHTRPDLAEFQQPSKEPMLEHLCATTSRYVSHIWEHAQ